MNNTEKFLISKSEANPGHYNLMLKDLHSAFQSDGGMIYPQVCVKADSPNDAIRLVMEEYEIVEDEAY